MEQSARQFYVQVIVFSDAYPIPQGPLSLLRENVTWKTCMVIIKFLYFVIMIWKWPTNCNQEQTLLFCDLWNNTQVVRRARIYVSAGLHDYISIWYFDPTEHYYDWFYRFQMGSPVESKMWCKINMEKFQSIIEKLKL